MLDFKKQVVASLGNILPTYYELFVDSSIELTCITYRVVNDYESVTTKEAGVSDVSYTIKVWGNSINDLTAYASEIDDAMRSLGFTRYNYNELSTDTQICLIMGYEGRAFEKFYEEI